jgi:hypothetical protein
VSYWIGLIFGPATGLIGSFLDSDPVINNNKGSTIKLLNKIKEIDSELGRVFIREELVARIIGGKILNISHSLAFFGKDEANKQEKEYLDKLKEE